MKQKLIVIVKKINLDLALFEDSNVNERMHQLD